jgi:hypothetical protein
MSLRLGKVVLSKGKTMHRRCDLSFTAKSSSVWNVQRILSSTDETYESIRGSIDETWLHAKCSLLRVPLLSLPSHSILT